MIHRYHLPYYEQVAVYYWPILFFELWRVDRWTEATGRWAVVEIDRYGRAWVPFWEGMSANYGVYGMTARVYTPGHVEALCPGWLAGALEEAGDTCAGRYPGMIFSSDPDCPSTPWIPAVAGIGGYALYLDPG